MTDFTSYNFDSTVDANNCPVEHNLCPVHAGDSIQFEFLFLDDCDEPINIAGSHFSFVAETDILGTGCDNACSWGDLVSRLESSGIFPNDEASWCGRGALVVPPSETQELECGKVYDFKFIITDGAQNVFTIGSGKFEVH